MAYRWLLMQQRRLWFKAKTYGWGWTPATWQGWLVTVLFAGLTAYSFIAIDRASHSVSDTLMAFAPVVLLNLLLLVLVCSLTGEKPRWRWGA